jgi:tetratricopeptide (TPR) repeat protein
MSLGDPPSLSEPAWSRPLDRGLFVLFWIALSALAIHRLFAYDIWWQMRAGEWILSNGIPVTDPFSFGFPGREWIEPRWLWCVLVRAVYSSLGVDFLILGKVVLLVVAFSLLGAAGCGQARWTVLLGMTLALVTGHERFMVRPELLSFAALTLTLLCLQRYKSGGSAWWIYPLPVVQLVWCNAHTLWVLGPATLWIFVAGELLEGWLRPRLPAGLYRGDRLAAPRLRQLAGVALASSVAALFNPYLLKGVLFPFRLLVEISRGHMFSETIAEFRGPFSNYFLAWDYRTLAYLTVIIVSLAGFVLNRRGLSFSRALLWLAFLFLSIEAQRNVALFGFVAAFVTILNLGEATSFRRYLPWVARIAVASFLVVMIPLVASDRFYRSQKSLRQFGFGVSENRFPIRAMAFVRESGLPTPVLHALGDGGYVLFEGGPESVYVDGRLEIYGSENLERAFRVIWTGQGLEEEADRTGARTVVVRNEIGYRPLLRHLELSDEWVPVYYDHLHLVYLRVAPETVALVQRHVLDWQNPARQAVDLPDLPASRDWLAGLWPRVPDNREDERLGSLLAGVGNYRLALEHFEAAHRTDPSEIRSRLFLGLFYEALGRDAEAGELLDSVPGHLLAQIDVHLLAGRISLWASNPRRAVEHFGSAVALGAPEPDTSLGLARAAIQADEPSIALEVLEPLARSLAGRVEIRNLLAVTEIGLGRPEKAIEHFEASLGLDPDQPEVYRKLGELYAQLGRSPD